MGAAEIIPDRERLASPSRAMLDGTYLNRPHFVTTWHAREIPRFDNLEAQANSTVRDG
jgi:hypothetical protein